MNFFYTILSHGLRRNVEFSLLEFSEMGLKGNHLQQIKSILFGHQRGGSPRLCVNCATENSTDCAPPSSGDLFTFFLTKKVPRKGWRGKDSL